MNEYRSLGVPLDGSAIALRSLGVATWLASRLSARLHVLSAGAPGPPEKTLRRLGVPEKYWPSLELSQLAGGEAAAAILDAERQLQLDLLVMTARGASGEQKARDAASLIGHVAREVIEQSRAPVLLLPPRYEEDLPWRSALVPLSGELGPDDALTVALRLAVKLDLSVSVAHVAAEGEQAVPTTSGAFVDELHHEYPGRLNELIDRACPLATAAERGRIEEFCLCHGDVAAELLAVIEKRSSDVIAVGWHGKLISGHAEVLKTLLEHVTSPLLLVKPVPREPFRLKVGEGL